jgi:hypothetical protein
VSVKIQALDMSLYQSYPEFGSKFDLCHCKFSRTFFPRPTPIERTTLPSFLEICQLAASSGYGLRTLYLLAFATICTTFRPNGEQVSDFSKI